MDMSIKEAYISAFRGNFTSTMRWPDLDAFWEVLKNHADDNWYIYAVGEVPPETTSNKAHLLNFIDRIDELLQRVLGPGYRYDQLMPAKRQPGE